MKGDCYCSSTTVTTTAGTDVTAVAATTITMMVVTATAGTATAITVESENGKWRNLNWCCGTVRLSQMNASCCNCCGNQEKVYSLHPLQTRWYNSNHANGCVDVEHEEKSLDYRPLMNAVNQCEATHH